jgi:hypothetical protein
MLQSFPRLFDRHRRVFRVFQVFQVFQVFREVRHGNHTANEWFTSVKWVTG